MVCWNDLLFPYEQTNSDVSFRCPKSLSLVDRLQRILDDTQLTYLVLTDEYRAAVFDRIHLSTISGLLFVSYTNIWLNDRTSLRCLLGTLLNRLSQNSSLHDEVPFRPVCGALNRAVEDLQGVPVGVNNHPTSFSDFDFFTMQRHLPVLLSFIEWKRKSQTQDHPLRVGDTLAVSVNGFAKKEPLLRFTLPLERPTVETLSAITRNGREHLHGLDSVLQLARDNPDITVSFAVEETVRMGSGKFSQVFFGSVEWTSVSADGTRVTRKDGPVCLKLFDEVFFPVMSRDECLQQFRSWPAERRLLSLNFATDMMRREHAAYERLQYLQGTLIPHSYGFHEFTLPDGRAVYGFFMEIVQGDALTSLEVKQLPEDVQISLVRHIRHGLRAIQYAGIKQGDWHTDQILVIPQQGENKETQFGLVFVDFAFTWLQLGEGRVAEAVPSGDYLYLELQEAGFLASAFEPEIWWPFDDFEC
ncbi:hypothetical protein VNI00_016306 [Paramarasmius palmivorus]|uniref:Protein kinase domain-containing protein n=1 Tax=Paramarasmius palmivorus TaxID=297713 RepID=A0AAW0BEA8_9AGAR